MPPVPPVVLMMLIVARLVPPAEPRIVNVPVVSDAWNAKLPPERIPEPAEPMLMVLALIVLVPEPSVTTWALLLPPTESPTRKFAAVMVLLTASRNDETPMAVPVVASPTRNVPVPSDAVKLVRPLKSTVALFAFVPPVAPPTMKLMAAPLTSKEPPPVAFNRVLLVAASAPIDIALEVSGTAAGLGSAIRAVRRGGTVVQVGNLPGGDIAVPANAIMAKELDVRGSFRFGEEFYRAVDLIVSGEIDVMRLVTAQRPLSDAPDAFRLALDRSHTFNESQTGPRPKGSTGSDAGDGRVCLPNGNQHVPGSRRRRRRSPRGNSVLEPGRLGADL